MKTYKKISIVTAFIVGTLLLIAPKHALACYGATCEGQDPKTTGCEADVTELGYVNLNRCDEGLICEWDDTHPYLGSVEFLYSPTCNATWARLYGLSLPGTRTVGFDSMVISGRRTRLGHTVSGRISAPSYGILNSAMVEDWGADACIEIKYTKLGPGGFEHDDSGCVHNPSQTAAVFPHFHVVTLTYAAPGKESVVTYGSGSTAGTETSASASFGADFSTTVGPSFISATGGLTTNRSTSNSLQVTRSADIDRSVHSTTDPIDHGNDTFFIWINPQVNVTFTAGFPDIQWALGVDSSRFIRIVPLTVYNAIDPTTIPAGYQPYLTKLTRQDYDAILSLDPYVDVATRTVRSTIPVAGSARFEPTGISMPLDGRVGGDFKTVDSRAVTRTDTYQKSISLGVSGGIEKIFQASSTFTWTYGTSHSTSWSTSQSASVSLQTPSTTFAGLYDVYFDRVFGTFLLVDAPTTPLRFTGIVRDSSGNPVVDERVTVRLPDGSQRVTYTDGDGRYRFHNVPDGKLTIEVQGERRTEHIGGEHPVTADFKTNRKS